MASVCLIDLNIYIHTQSLIVVQSPSNMGVVMMIQRNTDALSLLTVTEVLAWFDTQMLET